MKGPNFNKPGETIGIFCKEHKEEDMIDIKHKRCAREGCTKWPGFNVPGEKAGKFCKKHKLDGMTSVASTKCMQCSAEAQWGRSEFHRAQWCARHKPDTAVDVAKERRCVECAEDYVFIVDTKKYCSDHCPESSYLDMTKRLCKFCDIRERSTWVCVECRRTQHMKEWAVVRELRRRVDT